MHINFIIIEGKYDHYPEDPDLNWNFFHTTNTIWSYLTYVRLKQQGYPDIGYSTRIVAGAINVGTPAALAAAFNQNHSNERANPRDTVYVAIRADKLSCSAAQIQIVQSPDQAIRLNNAYYVTHWPQPGLMPRKADGHRVKKIGMAGLPKHYAVSRYGDSFQEEMQKRGVEIVKMDKTCWNNYSEIDVVLAVRAFNSKILTHKPPSKMINAWSAGVPVICNPEASYRWFGNPGKDYLEIETYEQLLEAIDTLREDGNTYLSLVESGRSRAEEFTNETVAGEWMQLFDGIRKKSIHIPPAGSLRKMKFGFRKDEVMNSFKKKVRDYLVPN